MRYLALTVFAAMATVAAAQPKVPAEAMAAMAIAPNTSLLAGAADLNGDGRAEIVVYLTGRDRCVQAGVLPMS